jgi:hypothetical protein
LRQEARDGHEGTDHRRWRDRGRVRRTPGAAHTVSALRHPPRTDDIATRGRAARDVLNGIRAETGAVVVPDAATGLYDLVLVAVRSDQLATVCAQLTALGDAPTVLFFGNDPAAAGPRFPPVFPAKSGSADSAPGRERFPPRRTGAGASPARIQLPARYGDGWLASPTRVPLF